MNTNNLPEDLKQIIKNEKIDFIVSSKRKRPIKGGLFLVFFGLSWLLFSSFAYMQLVWKNNPEFKFDSLHNLLNQIKFDEVNFPLISFFIVIGIAILILGIFQIFQKGGYFIGTKNALLEYRNGKLKTTDWSQFSGNIKLLNKGIYGDLYLELITGKRVRRSNSNRTRYVPDVIYLIGIENATTIYNKCKLKIQTTSTKEPLEVIF